MYTPLDGVMVNLDRVCFVDVVVEKRVDGYVAIVCFELGDGYGIRRVQGSEATRLWEHVRSSALPGVSLPSLPDIVAARELADEAAATSATGPKPSW